LDIDPKYGGHAEIDAEASAAGRFINEANYL